MPEYTEQCLIRTLRVSVQGAGCRNASAGSVKQRLVHASHDQVLGTTHTDIPGIKGVI